MTRRDKCYLVGKRARTLNDKEAAAAWDILGQHLMEIGDLDLPKFRHLLTAIRSATIEGKWNEKDLSRK